MLVVFGPWRPDLSDLDTGCTEAVNVVPGVDAYEPQASLALFASPLRSRCLGAISVVDTAGNAYWFAGDRTHLYVINSTTTSWSDVSNTIPQLFSIDGMAVTALFGDVPLIIPHGHVAAFSIPSPTIGLGDFLFVTGRAVPAAFSKPPIIIPKGYAAACAIGSPTATIEPGLEPGVYESSDPNLIPGGRDILNYLNGLTALGSARLLSGQYHFDHCQTIFNETGHWPAMCSENATTGVDSGGPWPRIMSTAIRDGLNSYWNEGGIPVMHGTFSNPKTHGLMNDPNFNPADMDAVVTENGNAINRDFLIEVDLVVDLLLWFQSRGVPIIFRPFYGMAQGTYWFGSRDGTNYTSMQNRWKALWRYFWTYLENQGVHNCIRVFSNTIAQGTGHPENFGSGFYPGDTWVDIAGVDMYKDLPGTTQWTDVTQNNLIRGVSTNRIQAFPEYGQQVLAAPGLHTDYRKLLSLSKDLFPYAISWMSWSSVWSMRASDNNFVSETLDDPWVVNREDLPNFGTPLPDIISPVRGFYMPSYQTDELLTAAVESQLDALVAIGANRAVLALHLRTPSATSNTVTRGTISEDVANLSAWFALVRSKGLNPALAFILFIDQFDWAGSWNPSNKTTAFANYYAAVKPWVQQAQAANLDYIVLTDEWSTLYSSATAITPFVTLINAARADYGGNIGFNVSNTEEADINPGIVSLLDFVGINAYIPLSTENSPTVAELYSNLVNPSDVPAVFAIYGNVGYTTYISNLAASWGKPIIMTTGYQSTVGAAKDPSGQPQTVADQAIQRDCWDAFLQALGQFNSLGVTGWRWWPGSTDDDGAQGFKVQGKLASAIFASEWLPELDLFLNPYNRASAHHRPIGTGAQYAAASHPAVVNFLQSNFTSMNFGLPYGRYVVTNDLTMPVRTVTAHPYGSGANLPISLRMPNIETIGPDGTNYPDNLTVIYNAVSGGTAEIGLLYQFYEFSWPAGQAQPKANHVIPYSAYNSGQGPPRCGPGATGVSNLFGLQRAHELNTDAGEILHAQQLLACGAAGKTSPMTLKNEFVWPAMSKDAMCDGVVNCIGQVPYGSLWALPQGTFTDTYINNSMGLNAFGKKLARQLRNYGGYFIDNGNSRSGRADQLVATARRSEYVTQMKLIYPHLRMVLNNTQAQIASGGGTPIATNSAYDANIFTASGPFNLAIPSNPALASNSANISANQAARGHIMSIYDYGVAIWNATPEMTKYVVDVTTSPGWGPNVFSAYPCPLTSTMVPSAGTDGAMCVIDWANRLSYEFWQYSWNGGSPECTWGAVYRLDSDGSASINGEDGPVGAGFSRFAGVVRMSELANGLITHPLVFSSEMSGAGFLYPAIKSDGVAGGSNLFDEGHRLQLNPSVNVDALGGPAIIKTIARALQTYGAYCMDNGGGINFIFEMPHPGETDPYPGWGIDYDYFGLEDIPWNQCRVLRSWNGT